MRFAAVHYIFDRESVRQKKGCQKQQNHNAVRKKDAPHKLRIVDTKFLSIKFDAKKKKRKLNELPFLI